MARKDWFKKKITFLNRDEFRKRAAGVGRMKVVRWKLDKDAFGPSTLYGYNMLSVKPGNDYEEFNRAMERIQYEVDCSQSPYRTL